jgi:hypothetical protein
MAQQHMHEQLGTQTWQRHLVISKEEDSYAACCMQPAMIQNLAATVAGSNTTGAYGSVLECNTRFNIKSCQTAQKGAQQLCHTASDLTQQQYYTGCRRQRPIGMQSQTTATAVVFPATATTACCHCYYHNHSQTHTAG